MRRGIIASSPPGPAPEADIRILKNLTSEGTSTVTALPGMANPHILFLFYGQSTLSMNGVTVPRNVNGYAVVPAPVGTISLTVSKTVANRFQIAAFQVDGSVTFVSKTAAATAAVALSSDRVTQTINHAPGDIVIAIGSHSITNNTVLLYGVDEYAATHWQSTQASAFGYRAQTSRRLSTTVSAGKSSNSYSNNLSLSLMALRCSVAQ